MHGTRYESVGGFDMCYEIDQGSPGHSRGVYVDVQCQGATLHVTYLRFYGSLVNSYCDSEKGLFSSAT
jgi:hypothetical protein